MPKRQNPLLPPRKLERFRTLRAREDESGLTEYERTELDSLIALMEQNEAAMLQPALERMKREHEIMEAQNRELEILIRRKEALLKRKAAVLAELQAEDAAI